MTDTEEPKPFVLPDGTKVVFRDWREMSAEEWIKKHGHPRPLEPNPLLPSPKEDVDQ